MTLPCMKIQGLCLNITCHAICLCVCALYQAILFMIPNMPNMSFFRPVAAISPSLPKPGATYCSSWRRVSHPLARWSTFHLQNQTYSCGHFTRQPRPRPKTGRPPTRTCQLIRLDEREGSSVDICSRSPPMHLLQRPRPITACDHPPCRCQGQIGGRHGSDGTTSASVLLGFAQGCSRYSLAASPISNPFPPDVPMRIAPAPG